MSVPEVSPDISVSHVVAHADMVARSPSARSTSRDAAPDSLALVSEAHSPHNSHSAQPHPDQHWDGRRVTLSSWYAEFETTLSYCSPVLYEFAVHGMIFDRTIAVIFTEGQAAQNDGAMPRPDYTWYNPAPSNPTAYNVSPAVVTAAYARLHAQRCLRDSTLDPAPPVVPPALSIP